MKANPYLLVIIYSTLLSCTQQPKYENNTIATAHPLASEAGAKMYTLGGNAADAAVAAAFTLAVVEPSMSGIGGRLQAIVKDNKQNTIGYDASTVVPLAYKNESTDRNGYKTIGVPGVVAGLLELHKAHGLLPLATVMQPAIAHAKNGFMLLEGEKIRQSIAEESIRAHQGTVHHFLKNRDSLFIQTDLAETLKRISTKGKEGFYSGITAQKMVKDMAKNGGYITLEDLKNYEVKKSKILTTNYKGFKIETLYLPSYGAITINILNILNEFTLTQESELDNLIITAKAIKMAYKNRKYQSNPDSLAQILSVKQAKSTAQKIKRGMLITYKMNKKDPIAWQEKIGHTTHLTTGDKNGMVVSLTQTIGPLMGSKVATKGLGFLYAVTMGGYLGDYKPGDRANSHITPTLASKNGKVYMALGAAGGSRIVTAVTQVLKNSLDLKMNINKSLAKGRVYPLNDTLLIENHPGIKWSKNTLSGLDSLHIPYILQENRALHGRINAIVLDSVNNRWIGASDPDWEGTAINNP